MRVLGPYTPDGHCNETPLMHVIPLSQPSNLDVVPRAALVGGTVPVAAGAEILVIGVIAVAVDANACAGAAHAGDGLGGADEDALVTGGGGDAADERDRAVGVELALRLSVKVIVVDDADGEVVV